MSPRVDRSGALVNTESNWTGQTESRYQTRHQNVQSTPQNKSEPCALEAKGQFNSINTQKKRKEGEKKENPPAPGIQHQRGSGLLHGCSLFHIDKDRDDTVVL